MCAIARKKKKIGLYINDVNAPFDGRKIIFHEQGKVVGVEKKGNWHQEIAISKVCTS